MLPIIATTKKKIRRDPTKFDFSDRREKKAKLPKVLSLSRACYINKNIFKEIV
jgi:hypothetical protein